MQYTLGKLIRELESVASEKTEKELEEVTVEFDFGTARPTQFGSRRGDYSQVQIGYALGGYDSRENHHGNILLKDLLTLAKETVGKTFEGRKGGMFTMNKDTRLWVSNNGNGSHTGITGVNDLGYIIILDTEYFEY